MGRKVPTAGSLGGFRIGEEEEKKEEDVEVGIDEAPAKRKGNHR